VGLARGLAARFLFILSNQDDVNCIVVGCDSGSDPRRAAPDSLTAIRFRLDPAVKQSLDDLTLEYRGVMRVDNDLKSVVFIYALWNFFSRSS
jgi:hypothetical protein